jgi:regulator of PEP synthase PpsR (kinase-PPPase family)
MPIWVQVWLAEPCFTYQIRRASITLPFIDSVDKAEAVLRQINAVSAEQGVRPIIFSTLIDNDLRKLFRGASALYLGFFEAFVGPLERELQVESSQMVGRAHGMTDAVAYDKRIEATDDGAKTTGYEDADVILIGVSRTGKTPTCLYLAMTYGIFAANYPLGEDELESGALPAALEPCRDKLFGLTISAERLRRIRQERRPSGRYASMQQVTFELRAAEGLFRRLQIPNIDTTRSSIEEISSKILSSTKVERRVSP